jgi:Carbohydrate binding module (family 6)
MTRIIQITLSIMAFAVQAMGAGFQLDTNVLSGDFDEESNPGNQDNIRSDSGKVSYITNGTWVAYKNFDFSLGATYFWIEATSGGAGGTIELRTGSQNGPLIGTVSIPNTGGNENFKQFGTAVSPSITGLKDVYFRFVGGGGYLIDTRSFSFQRIAPGLKQVGSMFSSGNFDAENAPLDPNTIRSDSGQVTNIKGNTWVAYHGFNFGTDANFFSLEGASTGAGGTVELRLDSEMGQLVGTVNIHYTGGWEHYQPFTGVLSTSVSGIHALYLRFVDPTGSGGYIFNTRNCKLSRQTTAGAVPYAADEDRDGVPKIWEYAFGMNPQSRDVVPLRLNAPNPGIGSGPYDIEVRLTEDKALVMKALVSENLSTWDEVLLTFQNGNWQASNPNIAISEVISQNNGLSVIRLKDSRTHTRLFARMTVGVAPGDLNVYPPVPGLTPSPYYTFSVQKVSALNATNKKDATNWLQPLAWLTRCTEYNPTANLAYFDEFIGGWSHTYCNFELDQHTPIVVKITRLNKPGAPSGPITSATVYPAHKVDACEVINGEVYVTMSQPALIAVDIDGQMDSRDTPRATPSGFGSTAFPHRNEMAGVHAVTIFANPVIKDKPQLGAPGVYAVEPGTRPPTNGPWTTLYFKPGIHKLSVDGSGNEREWQPTDPIFLTNNKNYYIPGDAIVYGNLSDYSDDQASNNIRVFGHGTISGTKIPHWKDFSFGELPQADRDKLRMLQLTRAANCLYEGITIADPAEHGVYIEGRDEHHSPNFIKWVKNISWRVNNDGGGVSGNGYVEDCFFRHQDDALYVRGMAIRRTVLWSDVNGNPFRCDFLNSDRGPKFPPTLPQEMIVEDCDIIYARGVFSGSDSTTNGIIGTPSAHDTQKTYTDGALNTGQHVIFRNIRVSDPKPGRYLFGFHPTADQPPNFQVWAGIRFENIDYQHPHTWGWKNRLRGTVAGPIKFFNFNNVFIDRVRVDAAFVNDPAKFETEFVSDSVFK